MPRRLGSRNTSSDPAVAFRWKPKKLGEESFEILDLRDPEIERRILGEMDAGVDVYYDRRWEATERFSTWLLEHPETIRGKNVLALGAGIGLETLAIGKLCRHLWINDLAPVSVELCAEQLRQNGLENFTSLPGSMTEIPIPEEIDLVVACFLIYEDETRAAMTTFLDRFPGEILVANGPLPAFREWCEALVRPFDRLLDEELVLALRVKPQ